MINISKGEAKYLVNNGVPYGEGGILHTYNKNRHYYLTESQKNLRMLFNYRNSRIIN